MSSLIWVLAIVVVIAVVAALLGSAGKTKEQPPEYKQADLLTANEMEFFKRLVEALPHHYIFPQVSLGALLRPAVSRSNPEWMKLFNRISSQRADFVIFDKNLKLVVIIELDDKTHNSKKDRERDRRTESAGISTIRYSSKDKPDVEQIRRDVASAGKKE